MFRKDWSSWPSILFSTQLKNSRLLLLAKKKRRASALKKVYVTHRMQKKKINFYSSLYFTRDENEIQHHDDKIKTLQTKVLVAKYCN